MLKTLLIRATKLLASSLQDQQLVTFGNRFKLVLTAEWVFTFGSENELPVRIAVQANDSVK